MNIYDPLCHTVSVEVEISAGKAMRFLSDPIKVGQWALGSLNTAPAEQGGIYKGISLFGGSESFFRIETDPKKYLIDYYVGDLNHLVPRISTRVIPGPVCGHNADHCIISMFAWRSKDMSDLRWKRLCAAHDAEILIIQSLLENEIS